ncbi:MAG: hypothetical protein Q8R18_06155 [bacterium]|nr:hypothetical protein [bacterium]
MTLYQSCVNAEKQHLKNLLEKKDLHNGKIVIIGKSSLALAQELKSIPEGSIFITEEETENTPTNTITAIKNIEAIPAQEKYEGIILLDSLSKVSHPREYLDRCYNLLKEEGFMLISVPNIKHPYWKDNNQKVTVSDHFRWKAHFDVNSLVIEKDFTMGVAENASFMQSFSQLMQYKSKMFFSGNLKRYYLLRKSKDGCRRNPDFVKHN